MKITTLFILALLSMPASASVINTADVSFGGNTYRTFQDKTTSLQWLDIDNFYNNSYDEVTSLLVDSGFHLATYIDLHPLFLSVPAIFENFVADAAIMNSATNSRTNLNGFYDDGDSSDGISTVFRYSYFDYWHVGGSETFNILTSSDAYSNLGAWVVADDVTPVPVPAAAWLFGSALLGFFGFSRRKATA